MAQSPKSPTSSITFQPGCSCLTQIEEKCPILPLSFLKPSSCCLLRGTCPNFGVHTRSSYVRTRTRRTCDWPGCKIHTKQNLSQLAQVNSTWLAVARRLHKTREATNKRLIDTCNIIDARHSAALPPALQNVRDPRRYFSLSSIFEGLAASKFDGVNLTIALYGSDLPVPDMQVTYLGREPEGPDAKVELDQQNDLSNERLLFPLHLRLDQWGASIENITGYALGIDQTWSSRMVWTGNILFNEPHPFHLGWFKASKPIAIDRDIGDSVPTHFVTRLSLPDPRRSRAKQLPATILERIFNAAAQYDDESIVGGPINFNLGAQAGWPAPPIPNWSWSQDLKRFAGVCKGWADVAKKLQQFEQTVANISGMTHASCMSFGDSVPEPNHIFAVTCVFEGRAASHFEGASLAICVPSDGIWADVDIEYIGDTWDGHKVLDTMPPALPTPQAHRDDSVCEVDHPICPISLCLCTSQDDADAYRKSIPAFIYFSSWLTPSDPTDVAIRDFPSTRPLCRRTIGLPSHSTQVFFGYFRSTRSFTGSASAAIPIHVVRISLPQPGRKVWKAFCFSTLCVSLLLRLPQRFAPLPDRIIKRIAWGVTELSDSTRRTECWSENLRVSAPVPFAIAVPKA